MSRRFKVMIGNERFLPRFGVERTLLMLARHLATRDVELSFAYLRADPALLGDLSDTRHQIDVPHGFGLAETDHLVAERLAEIWKTDRPDALVFGAWPFFEAAAMAARHGVHSMYLDAGAVPHDGLSDGDLIIQQELRRLRQTWMPEIAAVVTVSDFIRESQTEFDRGHARGVYTVRNGADLKLGDGQPTGAADVAVTLARVDALGDGPLICLLGRYEAQGYKNSPAAFDVLRRIRAVVPGACLAMLVGTEPVRTPGDLDGAILQLSTISDEALGAVMARSALGLSVSLWEGFNLPIAEIQAFDRPALAFNIGAHAELIADPWMLCDNLEEMSAKAVQILTEGLPEAISAPRCFEAVRERLPWARTVEGWAAVALQPAQPLATESRMVLVDVSNSVRDPGNSGVIRVTRRLSAELERRPELDLVFVFWDGEAGAYRLPREEHEAFLGSNAGPRDWLGRVANRLNSDATLEQVVASRSHGAAPPILLLPEVVLDGSSGERMAYARQREWGTAAILYDLLPVYHAQYVDPLIRDVFPDYLETLSLADGLWSISGFSLQEFDRYAVEQALRRPADERVFWLPGQFSDEPRRRAARAPAKEGAEIRIVCVSTIEPRKNHRTVIEAFEALCERRPDLPVRLTLIGNRYAGGDALASFVDAAVARNDRLVWTGVLSDAEIAAHYDAAAFSVYGSLVEGFGLPILESLWMGRPCICNSAGVMAELAVDGGCLTVDMTDPEVLSQAMERLAVDAGLRARLEDEARSRRIADWADYAEAICGALLTIEGGPSS